MITIILLVLASGLCMSAGHVFFKKTTNSLENYSIGNFAAQLRLLRDVLSSRWIWIGLTVMAVGLVIWLFALSQGELNLVFSLGSMQFVLVLFAARIFLHEKIDALKLLGTLLVVAGITLIVLK